MSETKKSQRFLHRVASRLSTLSLLACCATLAGFAARSQEAPSIGLPDEFDVVRLGRSSPDAPEAGRTDAESFGFEALGRRFDLDLRPASPFAAGAQVVWKAAGGVEFRETPRGVYLRGAVRGDSASSVSLRIEDGLVEGFILTAEDGYLLEPAQPYFPGAAPEETIIHRLSSGPAVWQNHECGADWLGTPPTGESRGGNPGYHASGSASQGDGLKEIELRLFLDSYYSRRSGIDSAERAHSVVHQVNAIFEKEFGVTLRITETVVSLDPSQDPVSGSLDPTILLRELGQSRPLAGADLAHLFTARDLQGSILGVAWMGVVCNPEYATGLSQDLDTAKARLVTTAHELAHGLGARHDGTGYCRSDGHGWIMWPQLDVQASSFSGCSRKLVDLNLPRFACVTEIHSDVPLPAPRPISPGVVSSQQVRFEWESVEGAQGYKLEVVDEDTSENVLEGDVAETSVQPQVKFALGHHYRWRVGTMKDDAVTARTEWQTFTVTGWRRLPGR